MFLFDSGARAEEFLNIRIGDLTKAENIYKVRIAFSKTKPRTIHLPICSRYLELWLQECKGKDEGEFLFPLTYDGLRMMLYRVGKRVLDKRVTPHVLRHSSATYYANLLKSPYKLCYRYGWSMASDMPKRYIDREGIIEEETPEIVKVNDISKLERQNQVLNIEIPGIIAYGLVIVFILWLFREFSNQISSIVNPDVMSPIENRILGLSLGTALGFFTAEFLF